MAGRFSGVRDLLYDGMDVLDLLDEISLEFQSNSWRGERRIKSVIQKRLGRVSVRLADIAYVKDRYLDFERPRKQKQVSLEDKFRIVASFATGDLDELTGLIQDFGLDGEDKVEFDKFFKEHPAIVKKYLEYDIFELASEMSSAVGLVLERLPKESLYASNPVNWSHVFRALQFIGTGIAVTTLSAAYDTLMGISGLSVGASFIGVGVDMLRNAFDHKK